jgi:hypothetical protein
MAERNTDLERARIGPMSMDAQTINTWKLRYQRQRRELEAARGVVRAAEAGCATFEEYAECDARPLPTHGATAHTFANLRAALDAYDRATGGGS